MKRSDALEKAAVLDVAGLMAASARTSPKTRGIDNIEMAVIDDEPTLAALREKMKEISRAKNRPSFERDAVSMAASPAVIIIGVKSNPAGLDCGFCGHSTCAGLKSAKGVCAYNSIDLGIAVDSAAAIANQFHIDNRVMYSAGKAGMENGLFSKDVCQALGIPLSATGKNPFFDRK